ncbi:hypothetical protein M770_08570 [Pseudomonas aeruginosa VRFPA03]|nr:hypothetical protein M770_08570 [Pseudomonas aeruginosa VRFPA03]
MLKIVLLVTGVAALLLSFIPSLRTEATPFLQHPDAIYLAILGLINLLFAPVLQSSHPTRPLQAGAAALLVLGVVLQALILLAPLPTIADQPAIILPLLSLVLATALQLAGSLKPICGLPLTASGQNSGSSADKVQQPTMPSLQLATRSSDLRTKVSANVRSIRATSQAGVPLADIHAAASCISRTTSSISPEQATRTFGGSSLSIRSPGAV